MLRIKSYNDGVRVYGYYNGNDYILITNNNTQIISSTDFSKNTTEIMNIDSLVGEIFDYFKVESYQNLSKKVVDLIKFTLPSKIDFEIIRKELSSDEEMSRVIVNDKCEGEEIKTKILNELNGEFPEIEIYVEERKSNKGYIRISVDIYK